MVLDLFIDDALAKIRSSILGSIWGICDIKYPNNHIYYTFIIFYGCIGLHSTNTEQKCYKPFIYSILLMHNIVVVSNIVTWCVHISHATVAIRNCGSAVTSIRYQIWIILSTQNRRCIRQNMNDTGFNNKYVIKLQQ